MTEKRGAVVALACVAVAVWVAVAWTVAGAGDPPPRPDPPSPSPVRAAGPVVRQPYTALFRDPFEPRAAGLHRDPSAPARPAVRPRDSDPVPTGSPPDDSPSMTFEEALGYGSDRYEEPAVYEPPPPPANPPLTFRGVVGDRAIFEDTAGAGLLLAVGDRVGEVRVTRVDSRLVILEVGGYEFLYDVPVPPRR